MNEVFPIVPLEGLSPVLYIAISTLIGLAFGFFLERAGFGSATNLTSIFILRDFRVFRVMFAAVITAMLGSQLLRHFGLLNISLVTFSATYFWAMLAGGLVFGVGFYVGGFCPGTALVALARGRWDGLAFLVGIVLGIYGFALLYDSVGAEPWFRNFFAPEGATARTLYGSGPSWPWVVGLTAVALIAFKFVPLVEQRFALKTVEQLEAIRAGAPAPSTEPPAISGLLLKVGIPLASAIALLVVVVEVTRPLPELHDRAPLPAAVAADFEEAPRIDSLTLAGWVLAEAHNRAQKTPATAYFVDVRAQMSEDTIPGAERVDLEGEGDEEALARLVELLPTLAPTTAKGLPLVLVGDDGDDVAPLAAGLRKRGVNAQILDGGFRGWSDAVLAPAVSLPMPTLRLARVEQDSEPTRTSANDDDRTSAQPLLSEADIVSLQRELRDWLAGRQEELPPRFAFPGTVPPSTKAVTVQARGGPGGGCG